jgi:hypothetical protein
MAAHVRKATPSLPAPPEIRPRALSIRSLDTRRPSADVVNRVRGEFAEMRGFSPTVEQAARLFALTTEDCGRILRTLVQEGFLLCTPDGRYRLSA